MENISKPWDWSKNTQEFWNDPAEESYFLLNRWKKSNKKRFLDLGCGLGRHSFLFADNGFQVESFDLSKEAIELLSRKCVQEKLKNIHCTHGDMNKLPFDDASFDCLLAYHVIYHTDSVGVKTIVDEIYRVLEPGAEFFLSLGSKRAWSFADAGYPRLDENTVIKMEDGPENGIPHFFSDEQTIDELFSRFTLINVKHVKDILINKAKLRNSWHYFILGKKD